MRPVCPDCPVVARVDIYTARDCTFNRPYLVHNLTALSTGVALCRMASGAWCPWRSKQATISDGHHRREPKSVNIFLGFFFLVNYSFGADLAIPYAFLHAGYMVAIPTLLVITFVSWIHASWVLETMARAQVR